MSTSNLPSKGSQAPLPLTATQPFIYPWALVNILGLLFVKVPIWSIYYLLPGLRPNPKWTWRQALMVRLVKFYFGFSTSLRPNWDVDAKPGRWSGPEDTFEAVQPIPAELLRGVASPGRTSVRAAARPGSWYPSSYDKAADSDKNVLLYFCGGAYVIGGHPPVMYKPTFDKLLPAINGKVFGVGYRFASNKGSHFPTQLIDALSAYQHLLNKGIPPSKIILVGDSAGGNLHLALLRYLTENEGLLPMPAAALLASPWVDMAADFNYEGRPKSPKFRSDNLDRALPDWGANAIIPGDMQADDPYFTPRLHPFKVSVPLWVESDANEVPFDGLAAFSEAMKKVPGNGVTFHVTEGGVHDLFIMGNELGFAEWVNKSVESIKSFLSTRSII